MIKIICFGKLKEDYLIKLVDDYKERINKYHKLEIIEIREELTLEKERDIALNYIHNKDYLVILDIKGKTYTSEEFATLIDNTFITYSNISFVIGSSEGIHQDLKDKANKTISFSSLTFPHGLFRGILLEQIYRAFKINNNERYHK